ncbi:MFS transporter [Stigmatella erecta]|uniref:Major Facilitator Superfamily protein n=1 Tax=Stigmatella erecta TaxID=83460 RepID=A0A1I0LFM4_9BACT|nr:MFS transporter [Stigmatella erecta]SEU38363.1 Major Facilitator Superfamily protein [Stigmatella erecta]
MEGLLFLRDNARWVAGGFLLFFVSSFGQTFFIALSGGDIRREYALTQGEFSTLYMAATLVSALTLSRVGHAIDRYRARSVVLFIVPMLALAAVSMSLSRHVVLLFVTLYLLRLSGQGLMSLAFTALGRWFSARRGRAISLSTLGFNTGEALLPLGFVALAGMAGWRGAWQFAAGLLVLLALPGVALLVAVERTPHVAEAGAAGGAPSAALQGWTQQQVLRDPRFYPILLAMVPPAFIGNALFFHQVYLAELRGWPPGTFASAFTLYASMTIVFTLVSGHLADRFSAVALLPFYLLPMGLGLLLLGSLEAAWGAFAFMILYGVSNGFSLSLFGTLWPEIYGVKHLGAIRSMIVPVLIVASAAGPGLTGLLMDLGVSYPLQIQVMGACCVGISLVVREDARRVRARSPEGPAQDERGP